MRAPQSRLGVAPASTYEDERTRFGDCVVARPASAAIARSATETELAAAFAATRALRSATRSRRSGPIRQSGDGAAWWSCAIAPGRKRDSAQAGLASYPCSYDRPRAGGVASAHCWESERSPWALTSCRTCRGPDGLFGSRVVSGAGLGIVAAIGRLIMGLARDDEDRTTPGTYDGRTRGYRTCASSLDVAAHAYQCRVHHRGATARPLSRNGAHCVARRLRYLSRKARANL